MHIQWNNGISLYKILQTSTGTWKNLIVGVIYRPSNTDVGRFNEQLNLMMHTIKQERKIAYIMGDFNINVLNHKSHQHTDEFFNNIYSNGFTPLITSPTRITGKSKTLIDNILTNNIEEFQTVCKESFQQMSVIIFHYLLCYGEIVPKR